MEQNLKRLFLGMEIKAPWPEQFPFGRLLDEQHRHMTLAFLGNTDYSKVHEALLNFPPPPFRVGFVGQFDQCLFLPPKHPHVIAWRIKWHENSDQIANYYETLIQWLEKKKIVPDKRHGFLPHVTLARSPFNKRLWEKQFSPLPLVAQDIHLYESLGNSKYCPLWSYSLLPPFEEIEHTADVAYKVLGSNYLELYQHAAIALAFLFPPLLGFLQKKNRFQNLEDVIVELNHLVAVADSELGCPFKAVSFHSQLETHDEILQWEMIIDV